MKSKEKCQGCGKHEYTGESCSCEEQENASENPFVNQVEKFYKIGYDAGSYDGLQMIRDILDMPSDEIRECFGAGFETGWEVWEYLARGIDEGSYDFISSSYDAWLKKKKAQKAADENEETVENLLAVFDNTIAKDIRSFVDALGLIKYGLRNISINYSSDSGNLSISVNGIGPWEAK